jgi:hypothetical protein
MSALLRSMVSKQKPAVTEEQQKTLNEILPTGPEHRGHGALDGPGHEGTPPDAIPEPLESRLAPSVPTTTAGR